MLEIKTKFARSLVAGIFLMGGAVPASAYETSFIYTADGGFITGSEVGFPSGGSNDTVFFHNDDETVCVTPQCHGVSWGLPLDAQSDLHINPPDPALGTVITNGPLVDLFSLTHHNTPTTEDFAGTLDLLWHLTLIETTGMNPVATIDWVFRINVFELRDFPGPMDDEFSYTLISGPLNNVFMFNGDNYRVSLSGFYDSLGQLTSIFYSPEGGSTTAYVKFGVSTVPEPCAIALMGIGMLGMVGGFVRRMKQQA